MLDRAIDQFGQVIDVFVSPRRDAKRRPPVSLRAGHRHDQAGRRSKVITLETRLAAYPAMLEELHDSKMEAWHRTDLPCQPTTSRPTTALLKAKAGSDALWP